MNRLSAVVPADGRPTLARCLSGIRAADRPPEELVVVTGPGVIGRARNLGAARTTGDVLVFVDSDVVVHPDSFVRIRTALEADSGLAAIFGSYDATPADPGVVSQFRNLLHHHVHQQSAGRATTFWSGLGAVRRDAFLAVGGFDPRQRSVEDIELGMRLHAGGWRIRLDPDLQGTHLKRWTLRRMLVADTLSLGAPWVALMIRHRSIPRGLNLGWPHRLSALAVAAGIAGLATSRPRIAVTAPLALVGLNLGFYRLLLHRVGTAKTSASILLHVLHYLSALAAVPAGVLVYLLELMDGALPVRSR